MMKNTLVDILLIIENTFDAFTNFSLKFGNPFNIVTIPMFSK